MIQAFLIVVFVTTLIFHVITRYNRKGRLLRKIHGPTAYPVVGNLLMFNTRNMHIFWEKGRKLMRDYYPITRLWYLDTALVHVFHPDDLEILMTSQRALRKGYIYKYLECWLKTGLLTSTNEKWSQRRKILTPAFHFNILKKYIETTSEQGEKFIESLKNEGQESVKSLIPIFSRVTLKIICESAMGVVLDKMEPTALEKYQQAVHHIGSIVVYRAARPYLNDSIFPRTPMGKKSYEALKLLHEFTDQVLAERRKYHDSTGNKFLNDQVDNSEDTELNDIYMGHKKGLAMLDLLLAAESSGLIDNEGIKEEVDTFIFEGHDTTSMAMTFTTMLLAENKEAQYRAREEVTEILKKTDGQIGIAEIQEFSYLERCIKESLRLYPPVATMLRYISEELQLKNALLPTSTNIMLHLWDTHRDSHFWPNPDKFNPDRFLPENLQNRHNFAYVPFSAGPRNCIGQKFAMMVLKSLLARILYDFYLEPIDRIKDMKLTADILLRPLDPVHIKFIKINK